MAFCENSECKFHYTEKIKCLLAFSKIYPPGSHLYRSAAFHPPPLPPPPPATYT